MLILSKRIKIVMGILLITLLEPMAWGESGSREQLPAQVPAALSARQKSPDTVSTDSAGSPAVANVSDKGPVQSVSGDGRGSFWIVGIIINLSVLGWFLVWAVKEWRKKSND